MLPLKPGGPMNTGHIDPGDNNTSILQANEFHDS